MEIQLGNYFRRDIESMGEFLESLEPMHQVYWIIAIPSSLVFILQLSLSFFGSGDSVDSGFENSRGLLEYFTLQNLVQFLIGFSWGGVAFYPLVDEPYISVILSLIIGIGIVVLFYYVSFGMNLLAEDNTFQLEEILGGTAEVYLKIPEYQSGIGKVLISHKGSYKELNAITNGMNIPTGSMVKVIGIENGNVLIVESLKGRE